MSKGSVRLHFEQMPTDDLLNIWTANDREQYAEQTFNVISDILTERGVDIPPQRLSSEFEKIKGRKKRINTGKQKTFNVLALAAIIIMVIASFSSCGKSASTTSPPPVITPKEQAEAAVTSFDKVFKEFDKIADLYQAVSASIGNGSIDLATGFSYVKTLNQQSLKVFTDAQSMEVPTQYAKEKDDLVTGASYLQNSIKELQSYFDDKKISSLSNAHDYLQQALNIRKSVGEMLTKQATDDGYTPSK
ncbi:MAG: hypothetical protein ACYCVD_04345 [Desulfitobacteriaceae bacterium]